MITITWKCNAIGHIPVAYPTCKLPILFYYFFLKWRCDVFRKSENQYLDILDKHIIL